MHANGNVPTLRLDGCAVAGQQVGVVLGNAPTTGWAILAIGYGRGTSEFGPDGCVLRVGTVLATTPLLGLVGGGTTHTIAVPPGFGFFDATVQGFCLDATAPRGFVASPGLEILFR